MIGETQTNCTIRGEKSEDVLNGFAGERRRTNFGVAHWGAPAFPDRMSTAQSNSGDQIRTHTGQGTDPVRYNRGLR